MRPDNGLDFAESRRAVPYIPLGKSPAALLLRRRAVGQPKLRDRAPALTGAEADATFVRFGDLPHQGQADAGAAGLGGEERHEQVVAGGQTRTVVENVDQRAPTLAAPAAPPPAPARPGPARASAAAATRRAGCSRPGNAPAIRRGCRSPAGRRVRRRASPRPAVRARSGWPVCRPAS